MTNKELTELKELAEFLIWTNKAFSEGKAIVGHNIGLEYNTKISKYNKIVTPQLIRYLMEDLIAHRETVGEDYDD